MVSWPAGHLEVSRRMGVGVGHVPAGVPPAMGRASEAEGDWVSLLFPFSGP